ncbi:C-type lectin domain family 2 member D isoform X2 [Suricata suricatta]|uniref:C-type lectin domain-containing protein n=1 Tax=Suricata suricatta TaxID=37032 RepID=A0A673TEP9_SURSU|nr:C-type lectin domain family 2 member D isoform X2 [Suricata suricatta]
MTSFPVLFKEIFANAHQFCCGKLLSDVFVFLYEAYENEEVLNRNVRVFFSVLKHSEANTACYVSSLQCRRKMPGSNCVERDCVPVELLGNPNYLSSEKHSIEFKRNSAIFHTIICLIVLLTVIPILFFAIGRKSHQTPSECLQAACPEDWIGFQRKCFYFSYDIKNWTFSQRFCESHDADLVQIETRQELDFLLRYKGPFDHWIGLSREQGQPWKWVNGTEWTSCFPIRGGGECAYLNDQGASSARHYTERKWICSKADRYANMRMQNAA